jgi:hypothetical protein
MQILEQALARLRFTTQGRTVAELSLVRIANLEDLDELPALIEQLKRAGPPGAARAGQGSPAAGPSARSTRPRSPRSPRRNRDTTEGATGTEGLGTDGASAACPDAGVARASGAEPVPTAEPASGPGSVSPMEIVSGTEAVSSAEPDSGTEPAGSGGPALSVKPMAEKVALTPENAAEVWNEALSRVSGLAARHGREYARLAISAPNRLAISFRSAYTFSKSVCERPDQVAKFERALADLTGEPVRVEFLVLEEATDPTEPGPSGPTVSRQRRKMEALRHPMIRRAGDLFEAKPIRVDEPPDRK